MTSEQQHDYWVSVNNHQPTPEHDHNLVVEDIEYLDDQVTIATVSSDGETAQIADINGDGYMDIIASDTNGDGIIADDEISSISDQNIQLTDLENMYYYQNDNTDDNNTVIAADEERIDNDPESAIEVQTIESDGTLTVATVSIEGQEAAFADVDGDGRVDILAADEDGDGDISRDEMFDISNMRIDVADLQEMAGETNVEDPDTVAEAEANYDDYNPNGYNDMIAMEQYSGYDDDTMLNA